MAFSSLPQKFAYQYTLLLAFLALLGSSFIFLSQLQIQPFRSQVGAIQDSNSRSPALGPKTRRPKQPIFENIPAQSAHQPLFQGNFQSVNRIASTSGPKGKHLYKRAPIGATWRQIRILVSDPDGPGQGWLLPGFTSLFNFLSFYGDFESLYQLTEEIREYVLDWRDVEENLGLLRAHNVSSSLNDYARAIGDFPRFTIGRMRALIGNLRETAPYGDSWADPEAMARYLFQVTEENPLIVDDRWFNMLLGFLQDSLTGMKLWIHGLIRASARCDVVIRELAPQPTYLENLDTIREDLGEIVFAFVEMSEIADWAYTNLTNFRMEIGNFLVQDQYEQTLPDTPTYQGIIPGEDYGYGDFVGGVFGNSDILGRVIPGPSDDETEPLENENPGTVLISGDIEIEECLTNVEEEYPQGPAPSPSED
ncbi:hypothetical protein TWF694_006737 [Orbilia ellipsospora]|uniref:Uncharacterized protein n=1 Tax=Orbilia ellipsospora TaxID=2528407 RepID=A0AAV9XL25_9PEZI